MLTYEDCVGMCDFNVEEINSIAKHERIPHMAAILLAEELIHRKSGALVIQQMMLDEILKAQEGHHSKEADRLCNMLEHFVAAHPDNPK